MLQKIVLVQ